MRRVAVLGGGLAGMATAYALAKADVGPVTLVERSSTLGGLAGGFEIAMAKENGFDHDACRLLELDVVFVRAEV